ncbi:hypothetical protein Mapa_002677 [Marchantia paleacea]|nr:hypothetical protein Mapa_002677 [Marchantia paleacea]
MNGVWIDGLFIQLRAAKSRGSTGDDVHIVGKILEKNPTHVHSIKVRIRWTASKVENSIERDMTGVLLLS